jgi:predicted solute-binding protein
MIKSSQSAPSHDGEFHFRIGSVPYLNAKPLIYGIEPMVSFRPPAQLAPLLTSHALDAALLPIVDSLALRDWPHVQGAIISCRGPVYSVFVAHRGPLEKASIIHVDTASHTSVVLMKVILRERFGLQPKLIPLTSYDFQDPPDNMLLIGNPAIRFRTERSDYEIFDLGEAWWEMTKLPFVFAVWVLHKSLAQSRLYHLLLKAKIDGTLRIEEIVKRETDFTESFRREYLTRYIKFDLGDEEMKGITAFAQMLAAEPSLLTK